MLHFLPPTVFPTWPILPNQQPQSKNGQRSKVCEASPRARHYDVCLSPAFSLTGAARLVRTGEESFRGGNKEYISALIPRRLPLPSYFHNGSLTGASRLREGHVALIKALAQKQISALLT